MSPIDLVVLFDEFLSEKKKSFQAVLVGSAALSILKIIDRETKDIDVIDPIIPQDIINVALDFVKEMEARGVELAPDWLNNGVKAYEHQIPEDWQRRTKEIYSGKSLILYSLDRSDLLKMKIKAYCERGVLGFDRNDCLSMQPSKRELFDTLQWLENLKSDEGWREHVRKIIDDLVGALNIAL